MPVGEMQKAGRMEGVTRMGSWVPGGGEARGGEGREGRRRGWSLEGLLDIWASDGNEVQAGRRRRGEEDSWADRCGRTRCCRGQRTGEYRPRGREEEEVRELLTAAALMWLEPWPVSGQDEDATGTPSVGGGMG